MSALGDRLRARCGPVTMVADLAAEVFFERHFETARAAFDVTKLGLKRAEIERDAARRELDELRQRVEGALGPARMMDRAEACQALNAVRAALDPAPPHQDAHAGCGDRLTDRGDVGPCIAVGPHDQHDDGHGITWTRSTV